MGQKLIAITIGPVQDFIYASRRTRDLWFGSMILSEISKSAARSLQEQKATLIFPHPKTNLTPWSDSRVANVILAEFAGEREISELIATAERAAKDMWLAATDDALEKMRDLVNRDLWDRQKDDVVEFYAAWGPLVAGKYRESRREVMRALSGRKALRDFAPSPTCEMGLKKSSLDGRRETVLVTGIQPDKKLSRRLRLNRGEQLDVVGLTRRLASEKPYPSVSGIAVDPWLRGVERRAPEKVKELQRLAKGNLRHDGTILFRERHHYLKQSEGVSPETLAEAAALLHELKSPPHPYYAVLAADGDKIGSVIAGIDSADHHRAFSEKLGTFAGDAERIVEQHHGALVFAGGDDVVSFLPEDMAVGCAKALAAAFAELGPGTTMSVGIAIVHYMEPLEDALSYARAAESHAKSGDSDTEDTARNALAVHLHTRSGAPLRFRARWTLDPASSIAVFVEAHRRDVLPDGCAYELARLADFYEGWPSGTTRTNAMRGDAVRILNRKSKREYEDILPKLLAAVGAVQDPPDLAVLANEVILARHIVRPVRQAGGME